MDGTDLWLVDVYFTGRARAYEVRARDEGEALDRVGRILRREGVTPPYACQVTPPPPGLRRIAPPPGQREAGR